MSTLEEAIGQVVASNRARWTPEQIELALEVAEDLAQLAVRKMSGESVDDKLVEAKAAAANIIASEALLVQTSIFEALTDTFAAILRRVLIGSGP